MQYRISVLTHSQPFYGRPTYWWYVILSNYCLLVPTLSFGENLYITPNMVINLQSFSWEKSCLLISVLSASVLTQNLLQLGKLCCVRKFSFVNWKMIHCERIARHYLWTMHHSMINRFRGAAIPKCMHSLLKGWMKYSAVFCPSKTLSFLCKYCKYGSVVTSDNSIE